jgi:hypothetical protein
MTGVTVCECGFTASSEEELADHLGEMFIPDDDIAPDGRQHAERFEPGRDGTAWECLCGVITIERAAFDAHLLAVFTPADGTGRDGQRHSRGSGRNAATDAPV